jgi:hypothetical protein
MALPHTRYHDARFRQLPAIADRGGSWSDVIQTTAGAIDAATARGSEPRLWDDDDVVGEVAALRQTSTQRPRRSITAA